MKSIIKHSGPDSQSHCPASAAENQNTVVVVVVTAAFIMTDTTD